MKISLTTPPVSLACDLDAEVKRCATYNAVFLVAFFAFHSAHAAAPSPDCLHYQSDVTLQGVLTRQTFAEQPNYENIAHGDAKATYFFLTPTHPICVAAGGISAGDEEVRNVAIVQLIFLGENDMFAQLRPFLGHTITSDGRVVHAITGHHHSRIMLETKTCKAVSK